MIARLTLAVTPPGPYPHSTKNHSRVPPESDASSRIESITADADLSWVVELLGERRDEILARWIEAAADQPFHRSRSEHAVADHIPTLFDALVRLLTRYSDSSRNPGVPLEDPDVLAAARSHAQMRFEQGFVAPDVVTEFRLLRQEVGRALRRYVSDRSPTTDVVGAELLLHDALDGAVFLALTVLSEHEVARRRAEVALLESERRIELERATASRDRDAFLVTLSHDLKNPLTSASINAQLLRRQAAKGPLAADDLAIRLKSIEAALQRAAIRLDELMDLARRDSAQAAQLNRGPVNLSALVAEVLERFRLTNDEHKFILAPGPESLVIDCDRDQIERSVDNVLNNAVKFSAPGGRISVGVSQGRSGDENEAVITVSDQGIGIPAEELGAIFERYHRGSNVGEVPGSGIGLWSVRRIVEHHGGQLEVESEIGKGSTFIMRLPADPAPQ